jgi:hypothetical protein
MMKKTKKSSTKCGDLSPKESNTLNTLCAKISSLTQAKCNGLNGRAKSTNTTLCPSMNYPSVRSTSRL